MAPPASGEVDDIYRRNTFTSTFDNAATEQAFLKSRLHDMHSGICFSSILLGSVMLLIAAKNISSQRAILYMATSIPLFSLAGAMRMPITKRCLGFRVCEGVVMAAYLAILAANVPILNGAHEDWADNKLKQWEYSRILALDTVVTCVHMALPVRWKVIVWGDRADRPHRARLHEALPVPRPAVRSFHWTDIWRSGLRCVMGLADPGVYPERPILLGPTREDPKGGG